MKVLGIDPSLTSTGLAVIVDTSTTPAASVWRVQPGKLRSHERLAALRAGVMQAARGSDLVVIEGLAFAAHDTGRSGAGLWWLLTHALWGAGVPVAIVPPTVRARYATGRGNAGKDEVLLAVARRYAGVAVSGNDEADALILAAMGARWLGQPLEESLPQPHLAAVASAQWPELVSA